MEGENYQLVNRVLKEYYEKNMSQKEIAYTEHISKSTVSRIITKAKEEGIVQIDLRLANTSMENLEEALRQAFSLEDAHVYPEILADPGSRLQDAVRGLAKDLPALLRKGDILSLGCGEAITLLADFLPLPDSVPEGIRIVQVCGMPDAGRNSLSVYRQMERMAQKLHAVPVLFPVPAIAGSAELAEALRKEAFAADALSLAEQSGICIFTAGAMARQTALLRNGMIGTGEFGALTAAGAAGEVLFHFLDRDGNTVDPELDARVMSLPLESLKKKPLRILVASGEESAEVICGVLRAGLANRVYTDERTARRVLELV